MSDISSTLKLLQQIKFLEEELSKLDQIARLCADGNKEFKIQFETDTHHPQSNPVGASEFMGIKLVSFEDYLRQKMLGEITCSNIPSTTCAVKFAYTLISPPSLTLQIIAQILRAKTLERIELLAQAEQCGIVLKEMD